MNKKIVPINIKGFEHYFVDEDGNTYALKMEYIKRKMFLLIDMVIVILATFQKINNKKS